MGWWRKYHNAWGQNALDPCSSWPPSCRGWDWGQRRSWSSWRPGLPAARCSQTSWGPGDNPSSASPYTRGFGLADWGLDRVCCCQCSVWSYCSSSRRASRALSCPQCARTGRRWSHSPRSCSSPPRGQSTWWAHQGRWSAGRHCWARKPRPPVLSQGPSCRWYECNDILSPWMASLGTSDPDTGASRPRWGCREIFAAGSRRHCVLPALSGGPENWKQTTTQVSWFFRRFALFQLSFGCFWNFSSQAIQFGWLRKLM